MNLSASTSRGTQAARKHRVYHALQVTAHKFQKAADREIGAQVPLTTSQAAVLSVLTTTDTVSQRGVAKELGQNESAVTDMVKKLIKQGYLMRQRSRTDARSWILTVTADGRQALRLTRAPFAIVNRVIDEELSASEVAQLVDMLHRMSAALEQR